MTPHSNSATKTKNLLQQNLLILKAKFFENKAEQICTL
jgi:hypothetical protein